MTVESIFGQFESTGDKLLFWLGVLFLMVFTRMARTVSLLGRMSLSFRRSQPTGLPIYPSTPR